MKKLMVLAALGLGLVGCTTVKYNGSPNKVEIIDYPSRGEVVTAYIGDNLVSKGTMAEMDALSVNRLVDRAAYNIPPQKYLQVGYDNEMLFFSPLGVIKGPLADPAAALAVPRADKNSICVISVFSVKVCYDEPGSYELTKEVSSFSNSFQQTLLYSGKSGDEIKISYREFSNDSARPAFNNDAVYDISESKVIGYKGAEIEVIKVDNTSITYRLLKNFP